MLLPREAQCDEVLVHGIITAATERRVSTVGEFGQFVRYLAAGYAREVAEAHRQYFNISGDCRHQRSMRAQQEIRRPLSSAA